MPDAPPVMTATLSGDMAGWDTNVPPVKRWRYLNEI
jgi:hypothetical protein